MCVVGAAIAFRRLVAAHEQLKRKGQIFPLSSCCPCLFSFLLKGRRMYKQCGRMLLVTWAPSRDTNMQSWEDGERKSIEEVATRGRHVTASPKTARDKKTAAESCIFSCFLHSGAFDLLLGTTSSLHTDEARIQKCRSMQSHGKRTHDAT